MRPDRIRLVDIGFHDDFSTSMSFAQSLIESLTVRSPNAAQIAEIEFIRTRDFVTVARALQSPAKIIHIMAHGQSDPDMIGFFTEDDDSISLSALAERFVHDHEGIEATVLFADCCKSATGRFERAVRDCLEQEILFVGARRNVNWHEATTFASAFYGAYFRDRGFGVDPIERAIVAGERAVEAYEILMGGQNCPFVAEVLTPSRNARRIKDS